MQENINNTTMLFVFDYNNLFRRTSAGTSVQKETLIGWTWATLRGRGASMEKD